MIFQKKKKKKSKKMKVGFFIAWNFWKFGIFLFVFKKFLKRFLLDKNIDGV